MYFIDTSSSLRHVYIFVLLFLETLPHDVASSAKEAVLSEFLNSPPKETGEQKPHFCENFLILHQNFAMSFRNPKKFNSYKK